QRLQGQGRRRLFLSQGRHAGLHQGGLRVSRSEQRASEGRRRGARCLGRFGRIAHEVRTEIPPAVHAAVGSGAPGHDGVGRVRRQDDVRQEDKGRDPLDGVDRPRRYRSQALEEGAGRGEASRTGVGRRAWRQRMTDYSAIERRLREPLGLTRRPIAIAFRDTPPAGVKQFSGSEPSGCSFWRLAMEGRTFFTVAADHYNCPFGAHTHNIPLPSERAGELPQVLQVMTGLGYLKMEEVPGIPRLPKTPGAVVYAPLGDTPVDPDVVLFIGPPDG